MKETYVSFEIAILLKEKGMPIPSSKYEDWLYSMYDEDGNVHWGCYDSNWYARITHQMALNWLRKEKNIGILPDIQTTHLKECYWYASIVYLDKSWDKLHYVLAPSEDLVNGYDEVIEQALEYVLKNLI